MNRSTKCGFLLLSTLMALSLGVAFGEKNTVASSNATSMNTIDAAGSNTNTSDAADVKEKEAADRNETGEDSVIIDSVTYSPKSQYVELKNNESSAGQDLAGWKLQVQNNTAYTFPAFMLEANAKVKVHSGIGSDSKTDLYAKTSLLTKVDDEVSLLDTAGNVVSTSEESDGAADSSNDA